jgi:WXXGXW repeat (2 copies)
MAILNKNSLNSKLPMAGALLVVSVATLAGCVVRVAGPPPPPPPRVAYVPPPAPAPAYAASDEPTGDIEARATEAPPPLPDYEQPPCPQEGYMWTPGYWGWGPGGGYYWVPGTWVQPPSVGVLWTPGYWGFVGGVYAFHAGYWGPHVGYYGGVNYGFGYVGVGFAGGRWVGNSFAYNRAVTNVNVTVIHNSYHETVVNNVSVTKVSYHGGAGGTTVQPTREERAWASEPHVQATAMQRQHFQESARNPELQARANGGHPPIAATPRPAAFNAPGVVGAHGAPAGGFHPPGQAGQPNNFVHTPGQPVGAQAQGQNGFARPQGQPNAAQAQGQPNNPVRTPGQPGGAQAQGQNGFARPQGQPYRAAQQGQPGAARPQGQPAQSGQPAAKQPPKAARAQHEEKKGEHEK